MQDITKESREAKKVSILEERKTEVKHRKSKSTMETLKEKLPLYQPKYIVKFDSCVDDQIRNLNGFVDPNKNGMREAFQRKIANLLL